MKLNPLGKNSGWPANEVCQVSEICLGTMTFGQQCDLETSFAIMDCAVAGGVNFFDLAEMYPIPIKAETQGRTEEFVGQWMKARGNRDQLVIATKATGPGRAEWVRGKDRCLNKANLEAAVDASLKRMQIDVIDLYQLHWPDRAVPLFGAQLTQESVTDRPGTIPIEETLSALQDLVSAGKIRAVGLSNETAYGTMKFLEASDRLGLPRVVSIQNAYSLLNRTFETGLAEVALREEVGLIPYAPIAAGFLTGKYLDGAEPEGSRYTLWPEQKRYRTPSAEPAIKAYLSLASDLGISATDLALAFVRQQPFVPSTIAGARTVEQFEGVLRSLEVTLSDETMAEINQIHARYTNPTP